MQPSRRPADTPFKQQRLNAWQPILTPTWVISTFLLIGIIFIPVGITLLSQSNNVAEFIYQYDGKGAKTEVDCAITANNEGKLHEDCKPLDKVTVAGTDPAVELLLNPCGLIANSMFNDKISLSTGQAWTMDETNIAWESDVNDKFDNPEAFKQEACECPTGTGSTLPDCTTLCGGAYTCGGPTGVTSGLAWEDTSTSTCYAYDYPNDDTTQYLYESYPLIVAPAG
ncbi:hypothetical protein TrRE_jg1293, partial [Triparma retinervis]